MKLLKSFEIKIMNTFCTVSVPYDTGTSPFQNDNMWFLFDVCMSIVTLR